MLQISQMYEALDPTIDEASRWAKVKEDLLMRSWFSETEIGDCILFVKRWSVVLQDVADWMLERRHSVELPTATLKKMGQMEGMSSCQKYIGAVMKAILGTPTTPGATKQTSNLYTPSDIDQATRSLKSAIKLCCQRMQEAEDFLEKAGADIPPPTSAWR